MKHSGRVLQAFTLGCAALLLAVVFSGCSYNNPDNSDAPAQQPASYGATPSPSPLSSPSPSGTTSPLTVTFSQINQNIIQPRCISCHSPAERSGGFDFTTYDGVSRAVVAGNPSSSLLYTSVASGNMPQGGPPLSADQVQLISAWIAAGAPER